MVFLDIGQNDPARLGAYLAERDILISGSGTTRLVTHLDIDASDIDRFVGEVEGFFGRAA